MSASKTLYLDRDIGPVTITNDRGRELVEFNASLDARVTWTVETLYELAEKVRVALGGRVLGEPKKAYYDNPVISDNGFPRHIRVDLYSPAERAIAQAVDAVEAAGAHDLLTDAVILLADAQRKVAEYVDRQIQAAPRERTNG